MKAKTIPLLFAVWLASLIIAFAVGRRLQQKASSTAEVSSFPSAAEKQDLSKVSDVGTDAVAMAHSSDSIDMETLSLADVQQLSPEAMQDLLETAFAMPISDPNRAQVIRDVLAQLAAAHPMEALTLANDIESLRDRERARIAILEVWGKTDPTAAMEWTLANSANLPQRSQSQQLAAIFRGYAQTNPTEAFSMAYGLSTETSQDERFRDRMLSEVIEEQIRNGGLEDAKLALQALEDGDTKNQLMRELVDEWASYDPASAAAYVSSLGDAATSRMKNALISEWAESDPAAAAAWLGTLDPEDDALGRATAEVIREWSQYDLTASAEWLNSLPASPELDWAVASFTFSAAQEDPASAMSWAESVSNDRMQSRLIERVAASWKDQDPEAFESYLQSSDYSEEEQEALRNAQTRGGGRGGPGGSPWGGRGPGGR